MEILLSIMLLVIALSLMSGFPVAFVLGGVSLLFALIGSFLGIFDLSFISALPYRIYGIMTNELLMAVPLFVFMGVMLEKTKIAEDLLSSMASIFGKLNSGLGISVMLVGVLLAASTGIVGATVITMGLISLPTMLKSGYNARISTGSICAAGTLGQIIPPSIVLILLGDQISGAYQTAQLKQGNFSPQPVSIADIFVGAIIPALVLVSCYIIWLVVYGKIYPQSTPAANDSRTVSYRKVLVSLAAPLALIVVVLGSILGGIATATESAAIGAVGSLLLALQKKQLNKQNLTSAVRETANVSAMVFSILIGAAIFTLTFRGLGGEEVVHELLTALPGGMFTVMLTTMILMFVLGFFLDFIEIIYVVVPIIAPVLFKLGADPIWLAVMIAINLQTSFLTPPFGFALFYLRGVAPKSVLSSDIYKGVMPFVFIQLIVLIILAYLPGLTTYLPKKLYNTDHTVSSISQRPPPAYVDF